jgi:hypothetical protein
MHEGEVGVSIPNNRKNAATYYFYGDWRVGWSRLSSP